MAAVTPSPFGRQPGQVRAPLPQYLPTKGRFSECAEAVSDDEDGRRGEQREDDPRQPILSSIQAFVCEQPSTAVLDHASDLAEA
ncbi:hypothetical protein [Azospirillum doebereinerae]